MGKNKKASGPDVTDLAIKTLQNKNASKTAKSLAGSALAQTNTKKQTGKEMESLASKVLQSDKYGDDTKSLAGSILSQSNKAR